MTTSPTHLSGHVHGEEAVEIVARALHVLLELEDGWDALSHGDRDAYRAMAKVSVESLTAAGLLATEQEWGVAFDADSQYVTGVSSRSEAERQVAQSRVWTPRQHRTVVSRGVTARREQA